MLISIISSLACIYKYIYIYFFYFRIASNAGRAVGVAVGCIIGMVPLLFYKAKVLEETEQEGEELVDIQNKN